jgi:hypothetical protein
MRSRPAAGTYHRETEITEDTEKHGVERRKGSSYNLAHYEGS